MPARLAQLIAAAALFGAAPAFASPPAGTYDDTAYPGAPATFANGVDDEAISTPDVNYPGPHQVVLKDLALAPPAGALGGYDDTVYPAADAPRSDSTATEQVATERKPRRDTSCEC